MLTNNEKSKFSVNFEKEQTHDTAAAMSTSLGRAATTIATAKQYHKKQPRTDPTQHIKNASQQKTNYYGQTFEKNEPFTIPQDEITHSLFVGSTGTGKGVLLGNRLFQSIHEKKGVIVVDPKNDAFAPQIIAEKLAADGRPPEDLQIVYFPNNWSYKAITDDDIYLEIANKLIDMFNFTPSDNPGVDYYRGLGRTLLRRLMKMFFVTLDFDVHIKKDFLDIQKHIINLKQDLERQKLYDLELGKTRPNAELLEKFSKRFFNPEILKGLFFANSDIETLDNLATKFHEITEGVTFTNEVSIADALYKGKIIYFRVDMNDIASLQWVKFMITDIIQKSKKKKANCDIYLDELSFYGSKTLAGALATVRSMGLNFSMFLQAISQLSDEIRDDILENSNFKIFYKSSNLTTLDYIEKVGGVEAITKVSNKDSQSGYSQDFEAYLNTTKIRALPRTAVAIVVAEFLPYPQIIQTNFVATTKEYEWSKHFKKDEKTYREIAAAKEILDSKTATKQKLDKYRVYLKESKSLLENSDLFGVTLGSELL